ncbi:hypothetical protein LZC95_30905 [Pendulispora brunnea]|uniref:Uncharacterized protein n=1 Tax=Pendulispora brunnea TaxID=2905690 RepID=A0ABZ2JWR6_9BACT
MNRPPPHATAWAAICASLLGLAPLACGEDHPTKDTRSCSGIAFAGTQRDTLECYQNIRWSEVPPFDAGPDAAPQPLTQVGISISGDGRYQSDFVTLRLHGLPERNVWNDFGDRARTASVRIVLANGVWFTDPPGTPAEYSDEQLDPAREATGIGRIGFSEILTEEQLRARIAKQAEQYGQYASPYYYFYNSPTHGRLEMRLTPKDRSIPEQEVLITF